MPRIDDRTWEGDLRGLLAQDRLLSDTWPTMALAALEEVSPLDTVEVLELGWRVLDFLDVEQFEDAHTMGRWFARRLYEARG